MAADDLPRDGADAIQDAWRRELPGVPVESIGVITRIWWAAKAFGDERRRLLNRLGVDVATLDLLSTLRRSGPPYRMSPGELAEACMVTRGAITQRVERAVNAGLVERTTSGTGYHARAVTLTRAGHALLDRVVADLLTAEDRLIGHLTPERRDQLADLLRDLLAGLDVPPPSGQVGDA
ncbi:Transcriptional regulator, MarR family [[Actinomadura] parvosata subsp. kistnae]|uniref:MarR family transcriptional regulator n=1 Tax=[Actinomadura] parvosata subsp. kistnae TaxID=1909395 RepID=A0A1V0AEA7_9ACTN|nr:MarR family transcriptional regulator [Nonomuraea sp. ATCC 55076]AQZ68564.1 MarR family transcriptional regulator [Nonomuraea sp. ATCC 55076]SPL92969.1 Transcriptional regulator, MarR family [Actinomadura parvosata subsp. kistnae]